MESTIDMVVVGRRLKDKRLQAGMKQEDLADKAGISRQTLSKWESGRVKTEIKRENLETVCDALGCSVEDILKGEGHPPSDASEFARMFGLSEVNAKGLKSLKALGDTERGRDYYPVYLDYINELLNSEFFYKSIYYSYLAVILEKRMDDIHSSLSEIYVEKSSVEFHFSEAIERKRQKEKENQFNQLFGNNFEGLSDFDMDESGEPFPFSKREIVKQQFVEMRTLSYEEAVTFYSFQAEKMLAEAMKKAAQNMRKKLDDKEKQLKATERSGDDGDNQKA